MSLFSPLSLQTPQENFLEQVVASMWSRPQTYAQLVY